MTTIALSFFDIFKIGPGPSSSHTMAPMKAGHDFAREAARLSPGELERAEKIEVRLYGSLSATGEGHGTDAAVVAGLMGNPPETCSTDLIDRLHLQKNNAVDPINIGDKVFHMAVKEVIYDKIQHDFPFSNTLVIRLLDKDATTIFEKEYYSVGGGFLQWKGWTPPERGEPIYGFSSAVELGELMEKSGVAGHDVLMQNEMAITGASEKEIFSGLDVVLDAMEVSVDGGLDGEGLLPGPLKVRRNAAYLYRNGCTMGGSAGRFIALLSAYALAASEENAAGHRVVTAPTCGAAGVIPAVYCLMKRNLKIPHKNLRRGLMAAAVVAFLCKTNASIAGAEVGCQGEIGVATAMASAMITYAVQEDPVLAVHAAAIALEHQLGLTCDPVKGYVQIPCIQRNAVGAVKAYNAHILAVLEKPGYFDLRLDYVIEAMAETGRDMNRKYKETGLGGLAVCIPEC
ncbi:MAG: L-serine ammonia-lyase [Deltaproteobacteria bacterium]|nr:L-serine ammonia-lyase [Deltaproteobacteria bacterium]